MPASRNWCLKAVKEMARILVIDDDQELRRLTCQYLRHIGYDVLTAGNGLEGVEVFRSCPDLIDLVVTDFRMPVMTGIDAAKQIRQTRPDAKIICMTGSPEELQVNEIPVLAKPFSLADLGRLISRLFATPRDPHVSTPADLAIQVSRCG